jgi:hypothetical protein
LIYSDDGEDDDLDEVWDDDDEEEWDEDEEDEENCNASSFRP